MFIYIYILSYYKLFLYFNLCLSVMLDSHSCLFTSISVLTTSFLYFNLFLSVMVDSLLFLFTSISFLTNQPSCNEVAVGLCHGERWEGRHMGRPVYVSLSSLTRQRSQFWPMNIMFGRKHYYTIIQSGFEIRINLWFFSCKIMVFIEKVHILRIIFVNAITLLVFGQSTLFLVGSIITLLFRASSKFRLIYCFFLVKSWFLQKKYIFWELHISLKLQKIEV